MQFFTLGTSKIEVSETYFIDIVTTHNDHLRYVKHVLGHVYVFFTFWGERGSPKGLVRNLHMQFFTLGSSKIEVSETCFFDIVTTQNDHPTYLKHFLGRTYVFFTLFAYWVRGAFPRDWYTTCLCSFSPWAAQKSKFPTLFFFLIS